MIYLYNTLLFEPIFNLLIFFYNIVPYKDIGISIILLTILVKLILFPLSTKSIKSQKALQELQPKLDALKEKYKDNKEKLASEMMNLYKDQNVNPLSSCLPLLIQFPFIIAVYQVFRSGLGEAHFEILYSFVSAPEILNTMFLGVLDLKSPQFILALLAAVGQYFQTKMLTKRQPPKTLRAKEGAKDENMMAIMNKQMMYIMPIITLFIGMSLPGGLALYWFVTTILTIAQQGYHFKDEKKEDEKSTEVTASTK